MHSPAPATLFKKPAETRPDDYVTIEGRKLYCVEKGQGEPVVLLHGFPDHCGNMGRYFYGLCKQARMIAYDRSGSGISEKPDLPYTLDFHVEELRALLDHLKIEQTVLLGHSIGGTLAILFAAKYPKRVKSLILLNTVMKDFRIQTGMNYLGAWFMQWPMIGEIMLAFHNRIATRECLKLAFLDSKKITREMVESYHFAFHMPGGKSSYLKAMRSIYAIPDDAMFPALAKLKEYSIPCLVLWTEKDWSMPLSYGRDLAERIHAKFQVIPHCGHSPHLELDEESFERHVLAPIRTFF